MTAAVRLGELIRPAVPRRAGTTSYPLLSMTMRHGLVDQDEKFKKRIASVDTAPYKVISRNQLVVGFPIDEGVLAFQRLYDEAIVSPAYDVWDLADPERVDARYLERYLRSPRALAYYAAKLRGTTARRRSLPRDAFLDLEVTLPEVAEQRRVVETLDRAEALRARRAAALALLDELAQAVFRDMFGDPDDLAGPWPRVPFSSVLAAPLHNGLSPSTRGTVQAHVLTLSAITGRRFEPRARKLATFTAAPPAHQSVHAADLLICRGSGNLALVGKGHYPPADMPDTTFPDTIIAARTSPDLIRPAFLQQMWNSRFVRRQIESVARTTNGTFKVNQTMLENVTIIRPPVAEQESFAARLARLSVERDRQETQAREWESLVAALQYGAFRGQP